MFLNRSYIFLLPALAALLAVSCQESAYINGPGESIFNQDSIIPIVEPEPLPDPEGVDIPEGTLDVIQACDTCSKLAKGASTGTKYYVKGWIVDIDASNATAIENYGNAVFTIATTTDGRATKKFVAYQVYGRDKQKINNPEIIQIGDFVVLYGELMNYNGTPETVGKGAAYIYASNNPEFYKEVEPTLTPDPEGAIVPEGTLNVYQAREICLQLANGEVTSDKYYVKGWIKKLGNKNADGIATYGNAQFYMSPVNDGSIFDDFMAFQVYGRDGKKITDASSVAVGDFVVVYGKLTYYNGTCETVGKGAAYIYYSTNPNW